MIDTLIPHFAVLGRRRSADPRADMLGDLHRGDADAAARRMDADGLVCFERAHDHDKLPGGKVADRNGGVRRPSQDVTFGRLKGRKGE